MIAQQKSTTIQKITNVQFKYHSKGELQYIIFYNKGPFDLNYMRKYYYTITILDFIDKNFPNRNITDEYILCYHGYWQYPIYNDHNYFDKQFISVQDSVDALIDTYFPISLSDDIMFLRLALSLIQETIITDNNIIINRYIPEDIVDLNYNIIVKKPDDFDIVNESIDDAIIEYNYYNDNKHNNEYMLYSINPCVKVIGNCVYYYDERGALINEH